jgi:hypothetical protein
VTTAHPYELVLLLPNTDCRPRQQAAVGPPAVQTVRAVRPDVLLQTSSGARGSWSNRRGVTAGT